MADDDAAAATQPWLVVVAICHIVALTLHSLQQPISSKDAGAKTGGPQNVPVSLFIFSEPIQSPIQLSKWSPFVQIGAFMNEAYQATHGLEADTFPAEVPTYLGHYHLPHEVGSSNVQYVGSPYQGKPLPFP